MTKSVLFLLTVVLPAPSIYPQEQSIPFDTLTLNRAAQLAIEYHPALRSADANVRSASAGLTQAVAGYLPSLNASATLSHTDGAFVFNPDFPPRNQTYNNYTTGVQVQQTLFDFGKTIGRVSANSSFVEAAESDYRSARDNVVMNVQVAYFTYVEARQVVRVNEKAVEQAKLHVTQAKAFYAVGKRAQIDVTRAEVDLANSTVNLIRAQNQVQLAKLQLENDMGVHPAKEYSVQEEFDVPAFTASLDSVKALAREQRPELFAAKARVAANKSLVTAAWTQHLPTLSASGNWTWSNFELPLFSRWNAGVTLTMPLFQGFALSAQVDQARANADAAQANLDLLTESVLQDVEQNYLSVKEAEKRINATAKLVEQAEQTLTLAEKQYAAGVGTTLEVTDAQLALSNARITRIQALYDYNTFLIRLRRSIGTISPE